MQARRPALEALTLQQSPAAAIAPFYPVRKTPESMKLALTAIGYIAVALGILGIFLPLLPTTPFLLLASACFVRSSPRLHAKLLNSPLGVYVRAYTHGEGLPRRAKVYMLIFLWTSLLFSCAQLDYDALKVLLIGMGIIATFFLLRSRSPRP